MTLDAIDHLRVATPCAASWEGMAGDEQVRHCTLCNLNVYNFAEMARDEVRELLARSEGRVCARLYRRADGTVLTRDCPTGLQALRRRASRAAAAWVTVLLSLPALAFGGTSCPKPRLGKTRGRVTLSVEKVAAQKTALFTGTVLLEGNGLPGVTVTLRDDATAAVTTLVTDVHGKFQTASLPGGTYHVEMIMESMDPATIEHLVLNAGEVTHATVTMKLNAMVGEVIMVGVIAIPDEPLSTTCSQDLINKLPL
jgi:hypothetical protein